MSDLRDVLGVPDLDEALLEHALTHRSFAYENGQIPNNERLEFLGDSVLGLVVTDTLFSAHPDFPEGQLAKLRAAVVSAKALADVARDLGIGDHVRLGRGEERENPNTENIEGDQVMKATMQTRSLNTMAIACAAAAVLVPATVLWAAWLEGSVTWRQIGGAALWLVLPGAMALASRIFLTRLPSAHTMNASDAVAMWAFRVSSATVCRSCWSFL